MPFNDKQQLASSALALYIINTGELYERNCTAARLASRKARAQMFVCIACDGAERYERDFGDGNRRPFGDADVLMCAAELAEYYAQHVAEM